MATPIVLFVYKRPRHFLRTLAALQANSFAAVSDLIIFSDGPKGDADVAAVEECRRLAYATKGFASVQVKTQQRNQGLARSVIAGVSEVMSSYGKAIVLEDDIVTAPHFLSYMNRALDWYRDDPNVFSITGYTYPVGRLVIPADYAYDTYPAYRSSSWGWACWKDRWSSIDWEMSYFDRFIKDVEARAAFNRGGNDLVSMLQHQKRGRIDSWAIRFAFAHHASDRRCIHPVKSLVSNIGLDNSGTHTGESPMHTHLALDFEWHPQRFCPGAVVDSRIATAFYAAASQPHVPFVRRVLRKLLKVSGLRVP
jgi:hypothetical protein